MLDGTTLGGGPFADDPDAQDRLLEFAQCMRDNGVPDFEDPQIGTGGPPAAVAVDHSTIPPDGQLEICQEQVNLLVRGIAIKVRSTTPGGGS